MRRLAWTLLALIVACGDDDGPAGTDGGSEPVDSGSEPADTGTPNARCEDDAECNDGVYCNGEETCMPGIAGVDGRGCAPGTPPCLEGQSCDEADDRCATECETSPDADGDGANAAECGGADCDDSDPNRYPGNTELCDQDGHDEDCDPSTFGTRDADNDGYVDARCCNGEECGDDCNDGRPSANPAGTETCNNVDDDCDGDVDEEVRVEGFRDADGDLHGDPASPMTACLGAGGFVLVDDDCDDSDPRRHGAQIEVCDGIDNDCNSMVDDTATAVVWYGDADGDGFGSPETGTVLSCDPVPNFSLLGTDCDDTRTGVNPAANEICDGIDNDCNGLADFALAEGDNEDDDSDGYADSACGRFGTDCDDQDPATYTGALEICDGRDNNCDGLSDDGTDATLWYPDFDQDGYGSIDDTPVSSCEPPPGHVLGVGDCDNSTPLRGPGVLDICDDLDNDCDGELNEDAVRSPYYPDLDFDGFGDENAVQFYCRDVPADLLPIGGDCDDQNPDANAEAIEICNGVDDDCDGRLDEGFRTISCGAGTCRRTVALCDDGIPQACTPGTPQPELCNNFDDDCDGVIDNSPAAANNCGDPTTTVFSCNAGECEIVSCLGQNGDCNLFAGDGCEAEVGDNVLNCGACGVACKAGDTCVAGVCQHTPTQIVAGNAFTCVVLGDTTAWCWGDNASGQLAQGNYDAQTTAVQVHRDNGGGAVPMIGVHSMAAGLWHACSRMTTGSSMCWGSNAGGQVTRTFNTFGSSNRAVAPSGLGSNIAFLMGGNSHQCIISTSGRAICWGFNRDQRLGGSCSGTYCSTQSFLNGINGAWGQHLQSFTRNSGGELWAWGRSGDPSSLGLGTGTLNGASPARTEMQGGVPGPINPRKVAVGEHFACALLNDQGVACTGNNSLGQLGLGDAPMTDQNAFARVEGLTGVVDIAAGFNHACAVLEDGSLHCWGENADGQLLFDTGGMPQTTPREVPGLPFGARMVAAGRRHTCVVLSDSRVYCWGSNATAELGVGDTNPHVGIQLVTGLP